MTNEGEKRVYVEQIFSFSTSEVLVSRKTGIDILKDLMKVFISKLYHHFYFYYFKTEIMFEKTRGLNGHDTPATTGQGSTIMSYFQKYVTNLTDGSLAHVSVVPERERGERD